MNGVYIVFCVIKPSLMEQLFQYLVTVSSLLSRLFVAVQILCEI